MDKRQVLVLTPNVVQLSEDLMFLEKKDPVNFQALVMLAKVLANISKRDDHKKG